MNKLKEKFIKLKEKNEIAFIPYMTAGFPDMKKSMENIKIISEAGADIIEVGIPFSDPVADGPTIQYSSNEALKNGASLSSILENLEEIKNHTPLVIMSYLNPVLAYGLEQLFRDMKKIGISGIIIPDIPVEESDEIISLSRKYDIPAVFLVAPTTPDERMKIIAEKSGGFIYCVSLTGTTGTRDSLSSHVIDFIRKVRKQTDKPLAVGFGISTTRQIEKLRNSVNGVIMGSRLIEAVKKRENLNSLVKKFKEATRR